MNPTSSKLQCLLVKLLIYFENIRSVYPKPSWYLISEDCSRIQIESSAACVFDNLYLQLLLYLEIQPIYMQLLHLANVQKLTVEKPTPHTVLSKAQTGCSTSPQSGAQMQFFSGGCTQKRPTFFH